MGAWLCFEDESGQGLRPPKGRTWGRRSHTPVVRVTARSSKRVSVAALIATRPGAPGRAGLSYRPAPGPRPHADHLARVLDILDDQRRQP